MSFTFSFHFSTNFDKKEKFRCIWPLKHYFTHSLSPFIKMVFLPLEYKIYIFSPRCNIFSIYNKHIARYSTFKDHFMWGI